MAGDITTPTPPDESTPLTPAADVPPESFLNPADLTAGATEVAGGILGADLIKDGLNVLKVGGELALLVYLLTHVKEIVALWQKYVVPQIQTVANDVIVPITDLIKPLADGMGTLSQAFVAEFTRNYAMSKDSTEVTKGTPVGDAAKFAFDSIVAPIAFFSSGSDPSQDGAGFRNIQQTLGVIVQLHLITWVINIISNVAGIGILKYFNSFTEVLLDALNARSLAHVAMRPYINTFITEPATAELNTAHPNKSPAASSDVREFIRGAVSNADLLKATARLGYSPAVTAQLLLDTAHLMSATDIAYVVKSGVWDTQQGEAYLQQQGYDASSAHVILHREINALVFENQKRFADALGAHYAVGDIDDQIYDDALRASGFTDLEAASYRAVYGVELEFNTKLTYAQVVALFNQGLVDLDFVRQYLTDKNNKSSDIDLLILLDFTAADQRTAAKAALAATARVQSQKEAEAAATATAKGDAALAAALNAQSAAKAALAAKYGK